MPANLAAGATDTGATQSNTQPKAEGHEQEHDQNEEQTPLREPIGARLGALLGDMGIELAPGVEVEGQEEHDEGEGTEHEEGPTRQTRGPGAPAKGDTAAAGVDELTEEQRRNTDPKLLKRIDKITAQLREAERKLAGIPAQPAAGAQPAAAAAPAAAAQPAGSSQPLTVATVQTFEDLQRVARDTAELNDWAQLNLDGADDVITGKNPDGSDKVQSFSAKEVRAILVATNRAIRDEIPQRAEQLRQQVQIDTERTEHDQKALERYPDVFTPGTEANTIAKTALQRFPNLAQMADGAIHLGAYVDGLMRARQAENGNGKGQGKGKDALKAFAQSRQQGPRATQLPRVERPSTDGSEGEQAEKDIREAAESAAEGGPTEDLIGAILDGGRRRQRSGPRRPAAN